MASLTLVRRIATRPSILFDMLTTPDGIKRWWRPDEGPVLLAETDPRVGGRLRVRFATLDGLQHEAHGEHLDVVRPARLVMTSRWADGGEAEEQGLVSRLEFDLRPIDSGTELTPTHTRLHNEASRDSHREGWSGALDKLAAHFTQVSA